MEGLTFSQAESGVMTTDELITQAGPLEAWATINDRVEKLGVRVNEMHALLTACVDSPLYILRALHENWTIHLGM